MERWSGIMKPAFTHLAMHVANLEATIRFYEDVCGMQVSHRRGGAGGHSEVVWMAEKDRGLDYVLVFIDGGPRRDQAHEDFSHLGFAVESRSAVDDVAERGREAGCLAMGPHESPFPVGYYCGLTDPDGTLVEFSYGQPLGPGADEATRVLLGQEGSPS